MILSDLSDLSSSDSTSSSSEREPQSKRQRRGALIVPGDPSRRLTTTMDREQAGKAVVARTEPVEITRRISKIPTKPAQGRAGQAGTEAPIAIDRPAAAFGLARAMVEATKCQQAKRPAPVREGVSVESSSMSRWIAGLCEAGPPPRQADDPPPTLLPRQMPNVAQPKPRRLVHSKPPRNDVAKEAQAKLERDILLVSDPPGQCSGLKRRVPPKKERLPLGDLYDPLTSSRPNSGADDASTDQQPTILRLEAEKNELVHLMGVSEKKAAMYENQRKELVRRYEASEENKHQRLAEKDERIRRLELEGRKKDARIQELEKEVRKRKAESERGGKKKFRFSIEVEVDGQAVEGVVADVEE